MNMARAALRQHALVRCARRGHWADDFPENAGLRRVTTGAETAAYATD
ncbi:hypothetical protein K8Z49_31560 [Actinomadura madurae]